MKTKPYYLLLVLTVIIVSCENPRLKRLWHVKSITYQSADSTGKKYIFTSTRRDSAVKYLMSLGDPEKEHNVNNFKAIAYIIVSYDNGDPDMKLETNGRMVGPIDSKYYKTRYDSNVITAMDSIAKGMGVGHGPNEKMMSPF